MKVIASWSGGKDSCLASYKAKLMGYELKYLLNFVSKKYKRCCFHGTERKLIKQQAKLIGIPLHQKEVSDDMKEYEKEFKAAVSEIKSNIDGIVFGDIYLDEHREWVERVCKELKLKAIEPLWGVPVEKVSRDFIKHGFKSIIVSAQAKLFDDKFVGKYFDRKVIKELKEKKICLCGENGEFHTFVLDGPLFKNEIKILKSKPVLKTGFWKYWFLDIQKWK